MLRPKIAEKLFETLIKPIVLNNLKGWGTYSKGDFDSWEKKSSGKSPPSFCKVYLGVNSKCSNVACRPELGRMPLT